MPRSPLFSLYGRRKRPSRRKLALRLNALTTKPRAQSSAYRKSAGPAPRSCAGAPSRTSARKPSSRRNRGTSLPTSGRDGTPAPVRPEDEQDGPSSVRRRVGAERPERSGAGALEPKRVEDAHARRDAAQEALGALRQSQVASREHDAGHRDVVRDHLAGAERDEGIDFVGTLVEREFDVERHERARDDRGRDQAARRRGADLLRGLVDDAAVAGARLDRPQRGAQEEIRAWERALLGLAGDARVLEAAENAGVLAGLARGGSALRGGGAGDEEDSKGGEGRGVQSWLHIGFLRWIRSIRNQACQRAFGCRNGAPPGRAATSVATNHALAMRARSSAQALVGDGRAVAGDCYPCARSRARVVYHGRGLSRAPTTCSCPNITTSSSKGRSASARPASPSASPSACGRPWSWSTPSRIRSCRAFTRTCRASPCRRSFFSCSSGSASCASSRRWTCSTG